MELVELFDNKRRPLDKVIERYGERGDEYTQVVHAWIRNSKGEFLMQKRSILTEEFFIQRTTQVISQKVLNGLHSMTIG